MISGWRRKPTVKSITGGRLGWAEGQPQANDNRLASRLTLGDALTELRGLPAGSIDLIACDLPYHATKAAWDQSPIDLDAFWKEARRVLTPTGTAVMFGAGLFTHRLATSAPDLYKYGLIWEKTRTTCPFHAKSRPMTSHEDILVFSKGGIGYLAGKPMTYRPQGLVEMAKPVKRSKLQGSSLYQASDVRRSFDVHQTHTGYPRSVLKFAADAGRLHPTQKPVALMEWLIDSYSNPGDVVLDPTMGSGSTGAAALNTGRAFVGVELDPKFFATAQNRLTPQLAAA